MKGGILEGFKIDVVRQDELIVVMVQFWVDDVAMHQQFLVVATPAQLNDLLRELNRANINLSHHREFNGKTQQSQTLPLLCPVCRQQLIESMNNVLEGEST
jgi:hypothetical protein